MSVELEQPVRVFAAERIMAMDGTEPEAFATQGGKVIASGSRTSIAAQFRAAEWTDLDGALVVPGFNDAHCHVSQAALARVRVDLTSTCSSEELRRAMTQRARALGPADWVIGHALDERNISGTVVNRALLDEVSDMQPVLLIHYSYHRAVGNSRALELLGYRSTADAPAGGELMTDSDGRLNGWMYERAWLDPWLPGRHGASIAPSGEMGAQVAALRTVNDELHAAGITSYCDAIVTPVEQELYAAALAGGALTARVSMLQWHSYFDETAPAAAFDQPERLRLAGVKMMLDGALSGGTCLCHRPYPSATGSDNGLQILDDEEFAAIVRRVHQAGQRAAVHANGDRAVEKVLQVYESLPSKTGHRINHRIEHCSMVNDQLIARMKAAGVTPVPFGAFIYFHGREIDSFYGAEWAERICAHRSLIDAGIDVAGSSDYPLVPANPLMALQSMVTRQSAEGRVLGPQQRLSVTEALRVYTSGSAHAAGEGGIKGRLAVGQLADFVVLDEDLTTMAPSEIGSNAVRSTWVGAECVWRDS